MNLRRRHWIADVDRAVNRHYDHEHPGMFKDCGRLVCRLARKGLIG